MPIYDGPASEYSGSSLLVAYGGRVCVRHPKRRKQTKKMRKPDAQLPFKKRVPKGSTLTSANVLFTTPTVEARVMPGYNARVRSERRGDKERRPDGTVGGSLNKFYAYTEY